MKTFRDWIAESAAVKPEEVKAEGVGDVAKRKQIEDLLNRKDYKGLAKIVDIPSWFKPEEVEAAGV